MEESLSSTVGPVGTPWTFFAATFAITWGCWLAAIALDVGFDSPLGLALLFLGLVGPGAAGIGFVYLVYDEPGRRDFWNRIVQVGRIDRRWLLAILLLPVAVDVTAAVTELLLGGTSAELGAWVGEFWRNPVVVLPTLFFATLPPLLEELGWRGYALDRLQLGRSALVSSVILGVVWALWHLPLFFIEGSYQHDAVGFNTLEFWLFMLGLVPVSVFITWVYNNTGRSILGAIVVHGWMNLTLQTVELSGRAEVMHISLWVVVAVVLVLTWGGAALRRDGVVPHPPGRGG